ncbi:MAG: DUF4124 domain-containing protein [Gammaproteobacteria bacterium]|nr:DUF4124 domain-containing protein [Gammaproteobacteria bacterium]
MNSASLCITLLALACLAAPAQAQLYKWVDSNGRVQYSDRKPPDGKQSQEVKSTVSAVGSQPIGAGPSSEGKTAAEVDKELQKQRQELAKSQQKQQQSAAEQKQKADSCSAAQRNLAGLQSGQRIARFDLNGEKSYLDDSGRARETELAQKQVDQYCN